MRQGKGINKLHTVTNLCWYLYWVDKKQESLKTDVCSVLKNCVI